MSAMRNNCMFRLPHELTGIGECCQLFGNVCNGFGKRFLGYHAHNAESRKALEEAIAERRKKREGENGNEN